MVRHYIKHHSRKGAPALLASRRGEHLEGLQHPLAAGAHLLGEVQHLRGMGGRSRRRTSRRTCSKKCIIDSM